MADFLCEAGRTRLDRLDDGSVMCCICMDWCWPAELFVDAEGTWDMCAPCGQRQAEHRVMLAAAEAMPETGGLPISQALVLVALVRVHRARGRATVRDVAHYAGRSVMATHGHLVDLRALGLVAWEENTAGTLRPLVAEVEGPWSA